MLDPTFIRPVAHRGLHDAGRGVIENTAAAFMAAINGGFAIECDLRPAAVGLPIVFHDATLDRLVEGTGAVATLTTADLTHLRHRTSGEPILTFRDLLDLVDTRVPLLVEVKSEWTPPDQAFLHQIAEAARAYRGPIALMSFDPAVMTALRALAPTIPRGIVSGSYATGDAEWWSDALSAERRAALRDLLESGPAQPSFFAYEVDALPTPVTRFLREVISMPLFTWTVRTEAQRTIASTWADAAIFEGDAPKPAGTSS